MESQAVKKVSRLRTAIPQVLAVSAKNLILFDMGLCIAFPTIVLPAVHKSPGELSLDDEQASWFASISMICTPVGSLLSGLVLERLGRKRSMMVVNIPLLVTWVLFYFVKSPGSLLATTALMGLSMGIVEAPVLTYVAEVSQPQLRGMLTTFTELSLNVGMFCLYLIGTVTDWRTTAAISASLPIMSIIAISQVPESPAWLMSRGRPKDAERSLCWLRGWVAPGAVQGELSELQRYHRPSPGLVNNAFVASKDHVNLSPAATEQKRSLEKAAAVSEGVQSYDDMAANLRAMLRPETLRPLAMVIVMSLLEHWCGVAGTRPYMVEVFDEFGLPIDAHWATVAAGLLAMCGVAVCLVAVPWCGKKPLLFLSVAGVVACCSLLGAYAYLVPPGVADQEATSWMPLALFIALFFTHSLALNPMPWMLLSEIFPFRTRSLAAGAAAAVNYVIAFAASKTFMSLKAALGTHGVYWLYAAVTAIGSVYLVFEFKETEGKSLHDIENYYTKKSASPAETPGTIVSPVKVPRPNARSDEDEQRCKVEESKPVAQFVGLESASADSELSSSTQEEQKLEGNTSPSSDETAEVKNAVLDTASPEVEDDAGSSGKRDIPSEKSAIENSTEEEKFNSEEEELPVTKDSSTESPAAPDGHTEDAPSSAEKEAEDVAHTNRMTRRLPSLPRDVQLRRDEQPPEDDGRDRLR